MDLNHICRIIFDAVCEVSKTFEAPVAYINVTVGKNFNYSDEEFIKCFGTIKWDTSLSTADIAIKHDDSMEDAFVRIDGIAEFMDESGQSKIHPLPQEKAIIKR